MNDGAAQRNNNNDGICSDRMMGCARFGCEFFLFHATKLGHLFICWWQKHMSHAYDYVFAWRTVSVFSSGLRGLLRLDTSASGHSGIVERRRKKELAHLPKIQIENAHSVVFVSTDSFRSQSSQDTRLQLVTHTHIRTYKARAWMLNRHAPQWFAKDKWK